MSDETPDAPAPAPAPPEPEAPKPAPASAPPEPAPPPVPAQVTHLTAVPDDPDGIDYLENGRVRFRIEGTRYTLRSPMLGEIKEFRTRWNAVGSEAGEADDRRDALERMYDDLRELWVWTFTALGDKRFPEGDPNAKPGWLFSAQLPGAVFAHWQAIPLPPGPR